MTIFLAFFIDIAFFAVNITAAILNRGEWIGWLFTALVIWQVASFVSIVREL
jgi:hypothetical protein